MYKIHCPSQIDPKEFQPLLVLHHHAYSHQQDDFHWTMGGLGIQRWDIGLNPTKAIPRAYWMQQASSGVSSQAKATQCN